MTSLVAEQPLIYGHSLNEVVFRVGKVDFNSVKVTVEDNKVVVKLQDEEVKIDNN